MVTPQPRFESGNSSSSCRLISPRSARAWATDTPGARRPTATSVWTFRTSEPPAVTQRSQRESDRPILFRRVTGTALPVVTNLYGSRRRLCELIGAADGRFCRRWTELMRATPEPATRAVEPGERIEGRPGDLPLVTYCERDAAPYITAGVFLAREPETGVPNLSFHRAMHVSDVELPRP